MKGISHIPRTEELESAYRRILHGPRQNVFPDPEEVMQFVQWVRFDPRLGEILIQFFSTYFKRFNPFEMASLNQKQVWPSVFVVLLAQVKFLLSKSDRDLFVAFETICRKGVEPVNGELFFIGNMMPGSSRMLSEVQNSIEPYRSMGYLCSTLLIPDRKKKKRTVIPKKERLARIQDFIRQMGGASFAMIELIDAMNGNVHPRQLQRDLISLGLRKIGDTKGTRWR